MILQVCAKLSAILQKKIADTLTNIPGSDWQGSILLNHDILLFYENITIILNQKYLSSDFFKIFSSLSIIGWKLLKGGGGGI